MKSGFFQTSQVLSEQAKQKTLLYPYGKTKITLNGSDYFFDEGVKLPHEIFHELSIRISLEFGYVLHTPFSHIDEIAADYLEEMFVDSYFSKNCVYLKKIRVNRTPASLIDASIILLNLKAHHTQIASTFDIKENILFPNYVDCITTRSYFYDDLVLYCNTNNVTKNLRILLPFLEIENLNLDMLKQVANSSIRCFREKLLFEDHNYTTTRNHYCVPVDANKVHYVEHIYNLVQSYCKSFEEAEGNLAMFGYENI
jgi:hypothetical protein